MDAKYDNLEDVSPRGRGLAIFCAIFYGIIFLRIPVHNIYLGHKKRAKYQFCFAYLGIIFFGIGFSEKLETLLFDIGAFFFYSGSVMMLGELLWVFVELILIAFGLAKDGDGLPVKRWFEKKDSII